MIGLILIFFVGKAFYELALQKNKSGWLYAILGVAAYYAGTFVGAVLVAIGYEAFIGSVDDVNDTLLGALGIPVGVLSCWGYYRLLKNRWDAAKTFSGVAGDMLDTHLIDKDSERLH